MSLIDEQDDHKQDLAWARRAVLDDATVADVLKRAESGDDDEAIEDLQYLALAWDKLPDAYLRTAEHVARRQIVKHVSTERIEAVTKSMRESAEEQDDMYRAFKKSADVQDFDMTPSGLKKVPTPATGKLESPKPTDATRSALYPPQKFPRESSIVNRPVVEDDDSVTPPEGYLFHQPGVVQPSQFLNFETPGESEPKVTPAEYKPSTPAPLRMGDAYQFTPMAEGKLFEPLAKRATVDFTDVILGDEGK